MGTEEAGEAVFGILVMCATAIETPTHLCDSMEEDGNARPVRWVGDEVRSDFVRP